MQIWKYPLEMTVRQQVEMPIGSTVLYVGEQDGQLMLWATGDPKKPKCSKRFIVVGTGQDYHQSDAVSYVGTAQVGPFVWHVFEELFCTDGVTTEEAKQNGSPF